MREYDLILGILACQLRLVTRGSLIRSVAESTESTEPLSEILLSNRALSVEDHELLIRLVDNIIHAHRGDEKAALETFGGQEAVESAFIQSVHFEDETWQARKDATILAEELPHGLPAQIMPETLGRYTGGSEYARGGIGRVLLVHDEQMGRDIILKELLPQHATSPTAETLSRPPSPGSPIRQSAAMMARFLQEAKVTGQLEHPSIVPVYELGIRTDGQLYYTMKLVRGHTLSVAIKQCKGLDTRLALLRSYLDICQAMAYAHSKSIIHRDLKPSNVMIGEFGECVVLDWGLAKVLEGQDAHQDDLNKTIDQLNMEGQDPKGHHTRSREVLGTPLYMAPEQARGENDLVGPRSDVYSLGVILYEILSGEVPHLWTNTLDTVKRVGTLPAPPLHSAAPDVAPELAAICDKALRHRADERYPSARELADDINQFLDGAVVEAYSYNARDLLKRVYRQHKTLIHSGALATAAILAIGIYSYIHIAMARDEAEVARDLAQENARIALAAQTQAETAEAAEKVARSEAESSLALALRQQYLAQIRLAQSHIKEQEMRLANEALEAAPESERDWVWRYLHNEANASLFRVRSEKSIIFSAHYDPTGEYIVAFRHPEPPGLYRAEDGEFIRDFEGEENFYHELCFDRTGQHFAASDQIGNIDVWDISSGHLRQRLVGTSMPNAIAFSNANSTLWAGYANGKLIEWSLDTGEHMRNLENSEDVSSVSIVSALSETLLTVTHVENGVDAIVAWNLETGTIAYKIPGYRFWPTPDHGHFIRAVHQPRNLARVKPATQAQPVAITLHNVQTGLQVQRFEGQVDYVVDISFDSSGKEFVATSMDSTASHWSLDNSNLAKQFRAREPLLNTFFVRDKMRLIGCTTNNRFVVWDLESGERINEFSGEHRVLSDVDQHPTKDSIVAASAFHTFEVFDTENKNATAPKAVSAWKPSGDSIIATDFVLSSQENVGAIVSNKEPIRLLELQSMQWLSEFESHPADPRHVTLSPDGRQIYYCRNKNTVISGSTVQGTSTVFSSEVAPVSSMTLDPYGRHLAVALTDGSISVIDTTTGYRSEVFESPSTIYSTAFARENSHLVVGCDDGMIRLIDIVTGTITREFTAHEGRILDIEFSPDGKRLASAGANGTVSLWSGSSWNSIAQFGSEAAFTRDQSNGISLHFTPTGEFLVIHNAMERSILVNLRGKAAILQPIYGPRFIPIQDGNTVVRVSRRGVVSKLDSNGSLF